MGATMWVDKWAQAVPGEASTTAGEGVAGLDKQPHLCSALVLSPGSTRQSPLEGLWAPLPAAVCTQLLPPFQWPPGSRPAPPGVPPGLHPGCAHPSSWPPAHTHHAPVGDTQVFGLPWHTAADHGSPLRGPPTMGTVGSTAGACAVAGRQQRARLHSAGPHILKHQLTTSFLCHRKCLYRNQTTERSKV